MLSFRWRHTEDVGALTTVYRSLSLSLSFSSSPNARSVVVLCLSSAGARPIPLLRVRRGLPARWVAGRQSVSASRFASHRPLIGAALGCLVPSEIRSSGKNTRFDDRTAKNVSIAYRPPWLPLEHRLRWCWRRIGGRQSVGQKSARKLDTISAACMVIESCKWPM